MIAVIALAVSGCSDSGGEAAIELSGERYEVDELHAYLETLNEDTPDAVPRASAAGWLTRWVVFTAAELELAQRGVTVSNQHQADAVAQLTEDPDFVPGEPGNDLVIRQTAMLLAARERVRQDSAAAGLRHLCSRHILVTFQDEAEQVLDRLASGEVFASVAVDVSIDPGSGPLGGDLGCVLEGTFVAPFEQAAYGAEPGDVVLAETQFGFHVIEVISSGTATASNHPQLDAETLQQMSEEARQAYSGVEQSELNAFLTEVLDAAVARYGTEVMVHERYGRWDPDAFEVVADSS